MSYLAKAPIRRLMKRVGADLVSADALDRLITFLENHAGEMTELSVQITKADNRKRVTPDDIMEARDALWKGSYAWFPY